MPIDTPATVAKAMGRIRPAIVRYVGDARDAGDVDNVVTSMILVMLGNIAGCLLPMFTT